MTNSEATLNVHVFYLLSSTGQRAAALAGKRPSRMQMLTLPVSPALVERAHITAAGVVTLGIGGEPRYVGEVGIDMTDAMGGDLWGPRVTQLSSNEGRRWNHLPGAVSPMDYVPPPEFDRLLTTEEEVLAAFDADRANVAEQIRLAAVRAAEMA